MKNLVSAAIPGLAFALTLTNLSAWGEQSEGDSPSVKSRGGWSVSFDGTESQPVVAGDVLFIGSLDGAVYAFDATSGEQRWRHQTGEGLTSGPEIIVSESNRLEDMLAATSKARSPSAGKRESRATPVVSNGIVYIGSMDHWFYALDSASGALKWRTNLGQEIRDEAIVTGQLVVVRGGGGPLFVLNTDDGRIIWSTAGKGAGTYPAIDADVLYFGTGSRKPGGDQKDLDVFLNAVDSRTGEPQWKLRLSGHELSTPVTSAGMVFVSAFEGSFEPGRDSQGRSTHAPALLAYVYAVEQSTGKMLWKYAAGAYRVFDAPLLTVGSKELYFVTHGGLHAVAKTSGALSWTLDGEYSRSVHLDRGVLFVESDLYAKRQSVFAVNADTGKIIWQLSLGSNHHIWAAIDGMVYVSVGTSLLALDATGKQRWKFRTAGLLKEGTHISAAPAAFAGHVIFPTGREWKWGYEPVHGRLHSINATTGKLD